MRFLEVFDYVAITPDNREEKGKIEAENRDDAYKQLYARGLYVSTLKSNKRDIEIEYRFKIAELSDFCRQIGNMLNAGIPLIKVLNIMQNRDVSQKIKNVYLKLYKNIQKGESFSAALQESEKSFDKILINMVKAGEASGGLGLTMIKLADYYDRKDRLNKKVKSAMMYPMVLVALVIVVVIAMFTLILPNFLATFEGMELPLITKILMAISSAMLNHAPLLIGITLIAIPLLVMFFSLTPVKIQVDNIILHLPKIGKLQSTIYTARFARTLSSLYTSGLGMVKSLQISIETVGSHYISSQFDEVIRRVRSGESLSVALRTVDGFDSKLIDCILIGEESGALDAMLVSMADTFDYDAEVATQSMVTVIEPVMIIIIAGMVGIIALGVMLPLMGIYQNVSSQSY